MRHYNPSIIQDARRIFNTKSDPLPTIVGDVIIATIPIERVVNISRRTGNATSGEVTIFTTPSDKDFYLTAASLSMQEDAVSDNTLTQISAIIGGVSQVLLGIRKLTLTARQDSISQRWEPPILLDRNTIITVTNVFTVGTACKEVSIQGYTSETISPSSQ